MDDTAETVARLLDLATRSDGKTARAGAIRRVEALVCDHSDRARSAALPELVARAFADADPRLDSRDEPRQTHRARRPAAVLRRLAANVASLGTPLPDPWTVDPRSSSLGRIFLRLDRAACARVVSAIGLVDIAFLCRDLDAGSASRLLRRLDGERAALPEVLALVPEPDPEALRRSCQRLALSAAGSAPSHRLVRSVGLRIVAGLISGMEGDVAATLARRIGCDADPAAFDPIWIAPAVTIVGREAAP